MKVLGVRSDLKLAGHRELRAAQNVGFSPKSRLFVCAARRGVQAYFCIQVAACFRKFKFDSSLIDIQKNIFVENLSGLDCET